MTNIKLFCCCYIWPSAENGFFLLPIETYSFNVYKNILYPSDFLVQKPPKSGFILKKLSLSPLQIIFVNFAHVVQRTW